MSDDDTTLELKGLDGLLKALKSNKKPTIRVGILGKSAARDSKGPSNATIGAHHEFGTSNLPQRSFLKEPLHDHLEKRMESSGALDKDVLNAVIATGSVVPWLKKIAVLAEGIVAEAFQTGGFGKWLPSNMTRKKVHLTLVETTQLRASITSEVKEG